MSKILSIASMGMLKIKRLVPLYILIGGLAIVACGGGGGSSSVAGGGIGGTGITASGAITGFGSVFVAENEFEVVPGATLISKDDNVNASEADLRVGMVVTVRGTIDPDGTISAESIVFDSDAEGPVTDVQPLNQDGTEQLMTVLGTSVILTASETVYDDGQDSGLTFDAVNGTNIIPGDFVKVSGFLDQNGDLHATFVERDTAIIFEPDTTEVEIKGYVRNLLATSFDLGTLVIGFDPDGVTTDLSDLPDGIVKEGQYVEVKGTMSAPNASSITAVSIEEEGLGDDEGESEIEGIVTGYAGLASPFFVAGQEVNVPETGVQLVPDTLVLANGIEVEVEGVIAGGVLMADEIKQRGGDIEMQATVTNVNPAAMEIQLGPFGLSMNVLAVKADTGTLFEEVTIHSLAVGDFLKVRAIDDGNGNLLATRIKRESDTGEFLLQGPTDPSPETLDPYISILGVVFDTTGLGNDFQDENDTSIGRGPFFDRAEQGGELVKIVDDEPADGAPDEVEFED